MLINNKQILFICASLSTPLPDLSYSINSEICAAPRQLLPCSPKASAKRS